MRKGHTLYTYNTLKAAYKLMCKFQFRKYNHTRHLCQCCEAFLTCELLRVVEICTDHELLDHQMIINTGCFPTKFD